MPATLPFVTPPPADQASPWPVIAEGDRTGGAVSFGDARIPPGSPGPGRHVHTHEDEAIYVVAGVLTVEVIGENRFEAEPRRRWCGCRVKCLTCSRTCRTKRCGPSGLSRRLVLKVLPRTSKLLRVAQRTSGQ